MAETWVGGRGHSEKARKAAGAVQWALLLVVPGANPRGRVREAGEEEAGRGERRLL